MNWAFRSSVASNQLMYCIRRLQFEPEYNVLAVNIDPTGTKDILLAQAS